MNTDIHTYPLRFDFIIMYGFGHRGAQDLACDLGQLEWMMMSWSATSWHHSPTTYLGGSLVERNTLPLGFGLNSVHVVLSEVVEERLRRDRCPCVHLHGIRSVLVNVSKCVWK